MASTVSRSAISVLLTLLFASACLGSSDVPFIVAHKKASLNRLKSGAERVSVSIDIYNQGSATAYDIAINDDSWPQEKFDIINGNTTRSWERLDGGALLSHSFELEAKEKGLFHGARAIVTFRIPTKSDLQVAYSTPIFPLDVLADRPPEKKLEWAKRLLAKYGALVSVLSIIGLFIHLITSPSKSSKKKRQ